VNGSGPPDALPVDGVHETGTGPGEALHLLDVHFIPWNPGKTEITISIDTLVDENTNIIGTPAAPYSFEVDID
jgi:hypothetical protein